MSLQESIKIPVAVLKAGETRHSRLDIEFPDAPVTFTLIQVNCIFMDNFSIARNHTNIINVEVDECVCWFLHKKPTKFDGISYEG